MIYLSFLTLFLLVYLTFSISFLENNRKGKPMAVLNLQPLYENAKEKDFYVDYNEF